MKCWEFIADRLSKASWSLGWVSAIDSQGRTIWIVDAHRGEGRRFIVRADEILSAFVELGACLFKEKSGQDKRGVNLIFDVLPFGRLWYLS